MKKVLRFLWDELPFIGLGVGVTLIWRSAEYPTGSLSGHRMFSFGLLTTVLSLTSLFFVFANAHALSWRVEYFDCRCRLEIPHGHFILVRRVKLPFLFASREVARKCAQHAHEKELITGWNLKRLMQQIDASSLPEKEPENPAHQSTAFFSGLEIWIMLPQSADLELQPVE